MIDPTGKTAAVTGGSSGIGLATAKLPSGAGTAVVLCGCNTERLAQAEQGLYSRFPDARPSTATCDVFDTTQMVVFIDTVEQVTGPIDALVSNADQGRVSTLADTDDVVWVQELHLEPFSAIRPMCVFMPQLERSAHGVIVCVNSLLAQQPESHMVATSTARVDMLNLVRPMAAEFAPKGVRVNGILIGLVEPGQWRRCFEARPEEDRHLDWAVWTRRLAAQKHIPLGCLGLPEEVACATLFLASPLSSYTTGSHINISGGHPCHA